MTDGGGLIFTLSAAGNVAWVLRYRHGTRRPEMTLGPYPAIGLSQARTMALVKRAEIAQGKNPIAERLEAKSARAKDWTVRQLIKDYREKVLVTLLTWMEFLMACEVGEKATVVDELELAT